MPVVRQISWSMFIPQLILLAVLVFGSTALLYPNLGIWSPAVGAGIYLIYSYGSRAIVTRSHQQGMQLTRQGLFREAIQKYEQSYTFFSKHNWIDRYRNIIMLTPSVVSYREMALINIAYCYAQLGEGQQAKEAYEHTLREFPDSMMAKSALNLIYSIEQQDIQ